MMMMRVVDDDTSPDLELDIADSPESSTTTTQTSVSTAELEEIPSKRKSSVSTSKTKRPWAASNRQKSGKLKRRRPGNDSNCRKTAKRAV